MTFKIYEGVRVHKGNVTDRKHATNIHVAMALMRNTVNLTHNAKWKEYEEDSMDKVAHLENAPEDVEITIREVRVYGEPKDEWFEDGDGDV